LKARGPGLGTAPMATSTFDAAELSLPLQWIEFEETLEEHDGVHGSS
jgi:hypothetical protein